MARETTLYTYLNDHQRDAVREGQTSILLHLKNAVEGAGWRFVMLPEEAGAAAAQIDGYHMVCNKDVPCPHGLNLRRSYLDPYWRIEDSNDRWNFEVAAKPFMAAEVDPQAGSGFIRRWHEMLFRETEIRTDGFIFMPLQGKLLRQRHFQSMSPLDMVRATLIADPLRAIMATLHPGEAYAAEEIEALRKLEAGNPRFSLSDQRSGALLARCDYVVTQNSGMAMTGFIAQKPAVLFGKIDFHHITASVPRDGLEKAFAQAMQSRPYGQYLYWFFRENAISLWNGSVPDQILARLRRHGWPI